MYTVTKYPHGTFSWADCASTDVAKARVFYTTLMGWTTEDMPMGNDLFYTFFKQNGHTVAAISPIPPQMQEQGMPSVWNSYVTVENVDALSAKVKAVGGTVLAEPFDVFEDGRMMSLQDPTGAAVNFWQPKKHIGASLVNTHGAMMWNELATPDAAKATAFFEAVLGWTFEKRPDGGYTYIHNNGRMNGGVMQMDASWGNMPAHWMVYFAVADIEAVVKQVPELGGKVLVGPHEAPSVGRFAVIADPAGAIFTAMQPAQVMPWLEHQA